MTLKRIIRDRNSTPEEVAKYRKAREQVAAELPELIARHDERMRTRSDKAKPERPNNG